MAGLNEQDIDVLRYYASQNNRELYWNYLAQHEGSDGYGLLALGVVRNDSMPGAVANNFAQNHARSHDGITLSERGWEGFGVELIRQDLDQRILQMQQHRPDRALNLPAEGVQAAHDKSFHDQKIDPNAWTPRQLLEAARRQGGEGEAEKVWHSMLDNSALGIGRGGVTLTDVVKYQGLTPEAAKYAGALLGAGAIASQDRSNVDPDVIGGSQFYYLRDHQGTWSAASAGMMGAPSMREVTDARTIAELEDAHSVRLERQQKATQFHPLDPHRNIARSPFTLAGTETPAPPLPGGQPDDTRRAVLANNATRDARDPEHPDHALHGGLRDGVQRLDAASGRTFDDTSERIAASLLPLAKANGITQVHHVVLSRQTAYRAAGQHIFVVQGRLDDPAMLRASMPTELAARTPVQESMQRAESLAATQQSPGLQPAQQQAVDQPQRPTHEAPVRTI